MRQKAVGQKANKEVEEEMWACLLFRQDKLDCNM